MRTEETLMRSIVTVLLSVVAALIVGGCMIGEVTQTLYFEDDGTLTWLFEERGMRSSESGNPDRSTEEIDWRRHRVDHSGGPAAAFWALGATTVETHLVRDRRPYDIVTRATFDDPLDTFERLFRQSGLVGDVEVEWRPRGGAISVEIDLEASEASENENDEGDENVIGELFGGDELRLMVASGRFVEAVGFEVEDDVARFDADAIEAMLESEAGELVLHLAWQLEPR